MRKNSPHLRRIAHNCAVAEMMTALAIRLLNFIKLVVQIENVSSVSEVLLPDFFPSDFLLGINYFAMLVNSLAYQ